MGSLGALARVALDPFGVFPGEDLEIDMARDTEAYVNTAFSLISWRTQTHRDSDTHCGTSRVSLEDSLEEEVTNCAINRANSSE